VRLKVISVLAALLALFTAVQWSTLAAPAFASACPFTVKPDFVSENWSDGNTYDVTGVRAPIQVRYTGTVCSSSGNPQPEEDGFDAAWISLEPSDSSSVVQIGIEHESIPGGQQWCSFYAQVNSRDDFHRIACGSANLGSGGTYNFFEITEFTNLNQQEYAVESCGTGGYSGCTAVADFGAFGAAYSPTAAETDFGQAPCTLAIMGSSTGIEHVGSDANPMQFQNSEGGSWATHVQNDQGATCGTDYKGDYSSTVLGTYDSRN
jgi:hypothetical protein